MFKDKLGKELQTAIDVILGYPGSYLYNEEEFIQDTPLAKASVEICFDKKFKKKEIRYAVLYPNILKIFKNEQVRPFLYLIQCKLFTNWRDARRLNLP